VNDLNIGYQAGQADDAEKYKAALRAIIDAWDRCDAPIVIPPANGTRYLFDAIGEARKLAYPQQGTTRDGRPWCGQCPDGTCVGREKIDACDIHKAEGGAL
jgi:hypothetical protein